jgi:CelD/BcsL family acetyltransferase involved in cellulose biosynthesis
MSTEDSALESQSERARSVRESWVGYSQPLQFMVGDFCLREVRVPGVTLDIPFMRLGTDLAETLPPWDELAPEVEVAVIPGQPVERDLPYIAFLRDTIRYVTVNENRYYTSLGGSFADYLKKFSSKSRSTLLRKVRRFAALSGGTICARAYRTRPEVDEFMRAARQVSGKTYQESLGLGLPDSEDFMRRLHGLAERDAVRGYILFQNERPVAYALCLAQRENLVYEHLGYDADFRQWSPGVVLLYKIIESLFAERRFAYLDFGGTEYGYKEFFSTDRVRCARVHYFRRRWRSAVLIFSHKALVKLSSGAAKALGALRLKARIKRALRLLQVRRGATA